MAKKIIMREVAELTSNGGRERQRSDKEANDGRASLAAWAVAAGVLIAIVLIVKML